MALTKADLNVYHYIVKSRAQANACLALELIFLTSIYHPITELIYQEMPREREIS